MAVGDMGVTGGDEDKDSLTESCRPVTEILSRIGDKWSILIVMALSQGPRRFSEIKRRIDGISQRMLTLTLRGLERDGLVSRSVTPSIPPRVDYELTELGHSLRTPVSALGQWAFAHRTAIVEARAAFDRTCPIQRATMRDERQVPAATRPAPRRA
ncbi:helix-turn-helix domain-containing protein [Labrys sp. LIt4]|uniref:winged helix-turn-helix transcriptional regulator n=1 Tax=Labrys sp. LIt4 TaxID=2821355 RepID=UPI001FD84AE3|nr:helix-turn-helix domain-containing protein [Labrys sp. LIt4]